MKLNIFKPTIANIVMTILLTLAFVPFIQPHGYECLVAPCPQPPLQSVMTQFLFIRNPIIGVHYDILAIGIVLSYVASCLILWGIASLRKK